MGRPRMTLGTYETINIHQSGEDRWCAQAYIRDLDGNLRRVSRWRRTRAQARRALIDELTSRAIIATSATGLTPNTKFARAAEQWLEHVARDRAGTTLDSYRDRLNRWVLPALGQLLLREVTVPVIDNLMAAHATRGLSVSTRQAIRSVISSILGLAVRHGALRTNPVRDLGRLEGGPKRPVRALTATERADLLAKLDADQQAVRRDIPSLVRFMLGTGTRIGEAVAVRWRDVDLDGQLVNVKGAKLRIYHVSINGNVVRVKGQGLVRHGGKTAAATRTLPLPEFVVTMLRVRYTPDTSPDEPVFPTSRLTWKDPDMVGKWLRQARAKAGYPWLTSHVFRKTAATILDEAKVFSAREIADQLGHVHPSMTQDVYMHRGAVSPAVASALDAAFRPATK